MIPGGTDPGLGITNMELGGLGTFWGLGLVPGLTEVSQQLTYGLAPQRMNPEVIP